MQFYKDKEEIDLNKEYLNMIEKIKSDEINNVCFECGSNDPEYISINNGIFICQECVQLHFQFPSEISQIIINDICSLNNNDIKRLYLGGNKKLIEFINFEFPKLKQFPPEILYRVRAIDYYRKRLDYSINGGVKPIKPIFETAYLLINISNNNDNINHKNDLFLSPKLNRSEKIFNNTELTPISEANPLEDENNYSSYSEEKNEEEELEKQKGNFLPTIDSNIKNESTSIHSPQKPLTLIGNNSDVISYNSNSPIVNKSIQNEKNNNNKDSSKLVNYNKKNIISSNKNDINDDDKYQIDKNISCINIVDNTNLNINIDENSNLNINNEKNVMNNLNLNEENLGDDNTIRIIDGFMNISKENDSSYSIKINNKSNNDSIQLNNKEKNEYEYDQSNRLITISNIDNMSEQSNEKIIKSEQKKLEKNNNEKIIRRIILFRYIHKTVYNPYCIIIA